MKLLLATAFWDVSKGDVQRALVTARSVLALRWAPSGVITEGLSVAVMVEL